MPFYRCIYHIIWATKHRADLIEPIHEAVLFSFLERKSLELGCELLAVNGTANHIHLAMVIPPALAAADVIGQLKGSSAREMNQTFSSDERFRWQEGYGIFTYGEKVLPDIRRYIEQQKEHHSAGSDSVKPYMEQMSD